MKASRKLLRALNVHRDEWWLVQRLFLLQFFQGAGITFFFTSAFSRFLNKFPVSSLAQVFILSSFLLWLTGFIYSKLEHHLSLSKLCVGITVVLAGSMLVFRAGVQFVDSDWFYFVMLAWFNVLYLLNNLMFWGIASQLYDVRQSKRLFGVISAGDIPAKFIGYSVALVVVPYLGTANLLYVGLVFILLSFQSLGKVLHSTHHEQKHHHAEPVRHVSGFKAMIKNFSVNILVRRVAVLSLIVSGCIILINYGFYSEVKHAYHDDIALATFIARFLALARLFALLIKVLFTSRLLYWLGNRFALCITPFLLIIMITSLLLTGAMTSNAKAVLYIFGLAAIVTEVLRSAIDSPVLLTMMQPLSTLERLRAHNIVKGIMDPFAYFLSGLFILAYTNMEDHGLELLSYVLLGLAFLWIIGNFRVHQQYLKTLIKTISSRFFTQDEFNLYDPSAKEMIEKKISNGTELEVLYILKMLSSRRSEESNRLIIRALTHPYDKIVNEALHIIGELHIKEAESELLLLIEKHQSEQIRSDAIKILSKIAYQDAVIEPLMNSQEAGIRHSAIVSILNHSEHPHYRREAEMKIKELFHSPDRKDKQEAAAMLCETSHGNFDEELIQLLNEKEPALQHTAIKAIGHHPAHSSLKHLIQRTNDHEKHIIEALIVAGDKALPFIEGRIDEESCHLKQKEKLVNAAGRIGSKEGHDLLLRLLNNRPELQHQIIKVLHRYRFKTDKDNQTVIESLIREYLTTAAAILHMQKKITPAREQYKILFNSLQIELVRIRESLLLLFSFLYDREKISKIKTAIEINKKETNANAIELVDVTIKKEFANPFNAAFEYADLEHKCDMLKTIFPKDIYKGIDRILEEILADKKLFYHNWTKACSLYTSKKTGPEVEQKLVNKYITAHDVLLKETAGFAAGNL